MIVVYNYNVLINTCLTSEVVVKDLTVMNEDLKELSTVLRVIGLFPARANEAPRKTGQVILYVMLA